MLEKVRGGYGKFLQDFATLVKTTCGETANKYKREECWRILKLILEVLMIELIKSSRGE